MISWFKKHFIPHEGNDNQPHVLRDHSVRMIIFFLLFLEIFSFLIPILSHLNISPGMATVLPAVLATLTNEERQVQNLPILAVSSILNEAAQMKALDMATHGYFAHTSPDGKTPWYWIEKAGYKYQYAGENLAINFSDSKDVTSAWMNSPSHKANIVKGNYTEMGTGIASGMYQGRETVFVAQVYANPLPKIEKKNESAKSEIKISKSVPSVSIIKENANILGAEVATNTNIKNDIYLPIELPKPTFWQKIIVSPRSFMNIILFSVFEIIFFVLLLYLLIKNKNYHKGLIRNVFILIAVIGVFFVANYYVSHRNMVITDSFDYSNENI